LKNTELNYGYVIKVDELCTIIYYFVAELLF